MTKKALLCSDKKEKKQTQLERPSNFHPDTKDDLIFIVAQQFYGNKTGTRIRQDKVDEFLLGMHGLPADTTNVDRKIIKVPGSNNMVIVYDQNQEDTYVNITFPRYYAEDGAEYKKHTGEELTMHVSCEIPELNFKIHTRCFACRMDSNGNLCSLEAEDSTFIKKYFV